MIWTDFISVCHDARNRSFLLSSHTSLDGDCVGAQLALQWYLTGLGKHVVMFNADPVPEKFMFLKNADLIVRERPAERFDVFIVCDCSNPTRLGWDGWDTMAPLVINIDHHRDNTMFGHLNYVKKNGAASGELVMELFSQARVDFPQPVAEALYTAIMTDTGGFQFSNTSSAILRLCADLVDRGADPSRLYRKVYASHSPQGLLLQARIWSTMQLYSDHRICVIEMPLHLIEEMGATYSDIEGMADCTVTAAGVEVGMLIKYNETQTHFSLRSSGAVDVGRIAQQVFGGGGHGGAAGCTLNLPVGEAKEKMLAIINAELAKY